MSQVRLYLDEDAMRRSLVFGLRARNLDVLPTSEAEMVNRVDQDHLAVNFSRVVWLTHAEEVRRN